MANNPKAKDNLRPVKKGEKGRNPNGRPKKLINAIKDVPEDMREKVFGILSYALTLSSEDEAKKYLQAKSEELGQFGFLFQIAIRQLTSERIGWMAANDILDRLYGKPKQSAEMTHKGEGLTIVVASQEEKDKLNNLSNLDI